MCEKLLTHEANDIIHHNKVRYNDTTIEIIDLSDIFIVCSRELDDTHSIDVKRILIRTIIEGLLISKASISNNINVLEETLFILINNTYNIKHIDIVESFGTIYTILENRIDVLNVDYNHMPICWYNIGNNNERLFVRKIKELIW